ncbi:proteoglycan 4-like [Penaeus japonicus]|uniref:proteoglycan 4-like n=1 Tax=Penaeus japonicus TaxID=27405 RepID=UPI001C713623|nr:proteoglycan 4-like [Penaeus japonicus]
MKSGSTGGIPGLDRSRLRKKLYHMLDTMKRRPRAAVHALMTGETPKVEPKPGEKRNAGFHSKEDLTHRSCEGQGCPHVPTPTGSPTPAGLPPAEGRSARVRRRGPAVMYLPINQEKADPCAPPKGSKLMEALPLVFLASLMSVADAVANINNANQINLVPLGGRALRFARAVVDAVGNVAMRAYRSLVPGSPAALDDATLMPPTSQKPPTPTSHKPPTPTIHSPTTPTSHKPPTPTIHSPTTPTNHSPITPTNHSPTTPTIHSPTTPTIHSSTTPTNDTPPT